MNAIVPVDQFRTELEDQKSMLQQVLPKHMPVDKFVRAAVIAATNTPSVLQADRQSLFNSLQRCAADGLVPDGREAALVEFNTNIGTRDNPNWVKKIQYMPMIDGVLKRARQTGEIATITARVVYTADEFDYWVDEDGEHLKHRPEFGDNRGDIKLVYAMAKLKDGLVIVEPMTKGDVDKVRQSSKNPKSGPWNDWYDRMALKTALHRLARRLPNSSEIMEMLDQGNFMYDFNGKREERDVTPGRPALSHYPEADFEVNFPKWEAAIEAGKRTPEQIIKLVESKAILTEEQRHKIEGVTA